MSGLFVRLRWAAVLAVLSVAASGCFYHSNTAWTGGSISREMTTESFRLGPFDLAPMQQPGWEVLGNHTVPRPAGNVALKGMDFNVVDAEGRTVGFDRVHLHHIVMIDTSVPDRICPSSGARFGGTGAERTRLTLLGDYAYRVDAGDVWRANYHIHTTSMDQGIEEVYIEYTLHYEPITTESSHKWTTPYFLDVAGCNSGSVYDVPGGGGAGSEHVASATYTAPSDGVAVFAGGHIHAGGLDLSLTRDATGEDYCTTTAQYEPGGHPNHPNLGQLHKIPPCLLNSEVNAGESFTLRSRYDNEFFVGKAMGIMLVHTHHP